MLYTNTLKEIEKQFDGSEVNFRQDIKTNYHAKKDFYFDPVTCGRPKELRVNIFVSEYRQAEYCPDCVATNKQKKRCLTCDTEFIPGCKIKFTCKRCYQSNTHRNEE